MKHGSGRFIPSLVTAALVVFALRVFSDNKADVDLWGNVGFVSALPWSTEFHYRNTYSFTEPDRLWINHEWGAEYLLNLAYRLAGNPGLLALKLVLGLAILGFVVRAVYRDCTTGFVRFVFLLLVLSTIGYGFSTRPHLFTYLLWVVFLVVLRSGSRGRGWKLFALSVLGIVWANLHGAFFLGCALLLVWGLAEFVANILSRPDCGYAGSGSSKFFPVVFLGAAGLFFVLSLFNPYGLRLWEFVFDSAAQFRPYLSEWAPFDPLMHFGYHTDFLALMALTLGSIFFSGRPKNPPAVVVLSLSLAAAVFMRRNIPLFAIAAALLAGEHVEEVGRRMLGRIRLRFSFPVQVVALVLFICVSIVYTVKFNKKKAWEIEIPRDRFPSDTILLMREMKLKGNALVFFDWAEYCIWKLYPECRQFLDGRFDSAYSTRVIRDYFNFLYRRGEWQRALKEYPTDIVLVHAGNPVTSEMRRMAGWVLAYTNSISCLFLKEEVHKGVVAGLAEALEKVRRAEARGAREFYYFP